MAFYGYNRPGAKVSEGVRQSFWLQGMMAGFPASYFCIKAFSETDQTEDLKKFDVPTLIIHGAEDFIVPEAPTLVQRLITSAELVVIPDSGHYPFIEQPEAFTDALRSFINRTRNR